MILTGSLYSVFFLLGLICYVLVIGPIYSYIGLTAEFSPANTLISLITIAIFTFVIGKNPKVNSFFFMMGMLSVVIPTLIMFSGASRPPEYLFATTGAFMIVVLIARLFPIPALRFPVIKETAFIGICLGLALSILALLIALVGFRHFNINIFKVYDFRREVADDLPAIFAYLNPIATSVLIPFGLVLSIKIQQYKFAIAAVVLSAGFFAFTGHKLPLIAPIALLGIYFIIGREISVRVFIAAFIIILSIANLDLFIRLGTYGTGQTSYFGIFGDLFYRRMLLIPSHFNWFYIEFFSTAEKYLWSHSKVSLGLLTPPYPYPPQNMIGEAYFGSRLTSANVGWIGSGFANAGYFGIILYSILVGLILSALNSYGRVIGERTVIALFTLPMAIVLTTSDLLTSLLNHGLLFSLFLLAFIPSAGVENLARTPRRKRKVAPGGFVAAPPHPTAHQSPISPIPK